MNMKKLRKLGLAAALLATVGCSSVKPRPAEAIVQAPIYQKLPTQTESEKKVFSGALKGTKLVYSQNGRLLQENLGEGNPVDLTASLAGNYGAISNPLSFPSSPNNIFFEKNGNLYVLNNGEAHLAVPGADISEYKANKDEVVFIQNVGRKSQRISRVNTDGSNLEKLLEINGDNLSNLEIAPDGLRAICTDENDYDSRNKRKHLMINLATGDYSTINFPSSYASSVRRVAWLDNNKIMFTLENGQHKQDIYSANLERLGKNLKSNSLVVYLVSQPQRMTSENSEVDYLETSPKGVIYVSSVGPTLFLKNGNSLVRLKENFSGQNPSVVDNK